MRRLAFVLALTAVAVGPSWADAENACTQALRAKKWPVAALECQTAAHHGNAVAQHNLAVMYAKGLGVPKNYHEAVKWYRKAAEQGNAMSQNGLGNMYLYGLGVLPNSREALKWYRKAAEQGLVRAQVRVGMMYADSVPKNYREAAKWFRRAAERGHPQAQNALGGMYGNGHGVPKNDVLAYMWMSLAAAQGYRPASESLAIAKKHMTPATIAKAKVLAAKKQREIDARNKAN